MTGRLFTLSEKEIENQILSWANMFPGVWARKVHTTGVYDPVGKKFRTLRGFAEKGVADIDLRIQADPHGKFGVIEVKTEKAAMSFINKFGFPCNPDQWAFIEKTIRFGGFGGVAWSLEMAMDICEGHIL